MRGTVRHLARIHHVTAISGNARRNLDFYTGALGLRLVKKTVNFDDPTTYHFYYGDEEGRPGTLLTFFPWEHAAPGRNGVGLAEEVAFRVPLGSIGYWTHRLVEKGLAARPPAKRFGEPVLTFGDPDGLALALVGTTGASADPAWDNGEIPAEHAIRGLHGVTLMLADAAPTAAVLTGVLGFREAGREGSIALFEAGEGAGGKVVLHAVGNFLAGRQGRGSVDHVAFRATDDSEQAGMVEALRRDHGIVATEQKDRQYFRSVYFREPGQILFEIATDRPGFTVDEPKAALGRDLKLPPFLEARRGELAAALPPLDGDVPQLSTPGSA
ncbi:MAG: ring-cleaving dioxygenase [Bauldia sp.]|nr:ring-cleaving dioxygenase [Bauldia sp.]